MRMGIRAAVAALLLVLFYGSSLALEIRHSRGNAFDSHPPLSERVAALRKTGHQPAIAIPPGRAIDLLRAPDEVARALVGAGRAQRRR